MADLAKLIEDAEQQLKNQSSIVKLAKEDVRIKEQAWQTAKGQQIAARKCAWQAAVNQVKTEREDMREKEAKLQELIERLPIAGKQALSLRFLLVSQSLTLLVFPLRLQITRRTTAKCLLSFPNLCRSGARSSCRVFVFQKAMQPSESNKLHRMQAEPQKCKQTFLKVSKADD